MTTLAIELNDASIRLARSDRLLVAEPGCALIDGEVVAVGSEAVRAARVKPHQASDRFWKDLSLEPLARQTEAVRTNADIAFAQLSSLWNRFRGGVDDVVLVVPASFTREQLGLLLGMAQACEMPVVGIVDAAVASSASQAPGELLHLELGLHQAVVTHVQQTGEASVSRGEFVVLEGVGLASLRERWIRSIAKAFVSQTRFDPLHNAHAEQVLYDGLPEFLRAAATAGATRIELSVGERNHTVEVGEPELAAAANDVYTALATGVERVCRSGSVGLVHLGAHAASLPGMPSMLARSRGVETRHLEPEAACMGALARVKQIRSCDGRFKLIVCLDMRVDAHAPSERQPSGGDR